MPRHAEPLLQHAEPMLRHAELMLRHAEPMLRHAEDPSVGSAVIGCAADGAVLSHYGCSLVWNCLSLVAGLSEPCRGTRREKTRHESPCVA